MTRTLLTLFFWLTTLAGMLIMMMSVGWMLGIFGAVFLPVIILHIVSCRRALRRFPYLSLWVLVSSLTFFGFALFRPDTDDNKQFTGLSCLLNAMNPAHDKYVHSMDFYFYGAVLFLIGTLVIDIILFRRSKRPPPIMPDQNEFV